LFSLSKGKVSMRSLVLTLMALAIVLFAVMNADARGRRAQADPNCAAGVCSPGVVEVPQETAKIWPFTKPDAQPTKPTIVIEVATLPPVPAPVPSATVSPPTVTPSEVAVCAGAYEQAATTHRKPLRRILKGVLIGVGEAAKGTAKLGAAIVGHERRVARRAGRRCGE
jgi:hypothetical protein